jgi:hypothetical protein
MLSTALPLLWVIAVRVLGGYEKRFLGAGSDEFRRVLNAGLSLTGGQAVISYADVFDWGCKVRNEDTHL